MEGSGTLSTSASWASASSVLHRVGRSAAHACLTRGERATEVLARWRCAWRSVLHLAGKPTSSVLSRRHASARPWPGGTSLHGPVASASAHARWSRGWSRMSSASTTSAFTSSSRHSGERCGRLSRRHACSRPSPGSTSAQKRSTSARHASRRGKSSRRLSALAAMKRTSAERHAGPSMCARFSWRHRSCCPLPAGRWWHSSRTSALHDALTSTSSRMSEKSRAWSRSSSRLHAAPISASYFLLRRHCTTRAFPLSTSAHSFLRSFAQCLKTPCLKRQSVEATTSRLKSFASHRSESCARCALRQLRSRPSPGCAPAHSPLRSAAHACMSGRSSRMSTAAALIFFSMSRLHDGCSSTVRFAWRHSTTAPCAGALPARWTACEQCDAMSLPHRRRRRQSRR
mmetsp:Transcript_19141/g.62404  ORF Transcript_19141/g.62404 Transcript_19141/m.62404 type:complete len:400 (-) Transcript_19141:954-2153(-)